MRCIGAMIARISSRPQAGSEDGDDQRHGHADLGRQHRLVDRRRGPVRHALVLSNDVVELHAPFSPDRRQLLFQQCARTRQVIGLDALQHLAQDLVVGEVGRLEVIELHAIGLAMYGFFVVGHLLFNTRFERLVVRLIRIVQGFVVAQADDVDGMQVAVDPGAADHRAEVDPRHRIVPDGFLAGFDLQQP